MNDCNGKENDVMVSYGAGQREVLPGMRWQDRITGIVWEVVEPTGTRSYSPFGSVGTPNFWCRCVEPKPGIERWRDQAREDGCIPFCGDSIAGSPSTNSTNHGAESDE